MITVDVQVKANERQISLFVVEKIIKWEHLDKYILLVVIMFTFWIIEKIKYASSVNKKGCHPFSLLKARRREEDKNENVWIFFIFSLFTFELN